MGEDRDGRKGEGDTNGRNDPLDLTGLVTDVSIIVKIRHQRRQRNDTERHDREALGWTSARFILGTTLGVCRIRRWCRHDGGTRCVWVL